MTFDRPQDYWSSSPRRVLSNGNIGSRDIGCHDELFDAHGDANSAGPIRKLALPISHDPVRCQHAKGPQTMEYHMGNPMMSVPAHSDDAMWSYCMRKFLVPC